MASFMLRAASMEKKSNSNDENKGGSEKTSSKTKKNAKSSSSSKKPPQRGLGVAQLERLRLQERLKKLEEIGQAEASAHLKNQPRLHFQFPFSYLEQPKAFGASSVVPFTGPVSFSTTASGEVQSGFVFQPYRFVNGGGDGGLVAGVNGGVQSVVVQERVEGKAPQDGYGMVDHEARLQQRAKCIKMAKEKELTSTQIHCSSDQCHICHKKKRLNGESNSTLGFVPKTRMNCLDSLGLSLGRKTTIDEQAMGVHKNSNGGGGGSIMEYDFFPGSSGSTSNSSNKDYSYSSSVGGAEGSSGADSAGGVVLGGGGDGSSGIHFVDLSLKLSW